ncbi:hypothetical protein Ndes2526B_g01652 [Nannochloris sp. 'desiccata']|nr:hypothetical protein NADE_002425 [Chlorella desiccata (nom. nud.)]
MATDKEIEFQRLLDELSKLTTERDAAISSLDQVDEHLNALSAAIGLTSCGLNTPAGLLCVLRPVTHLADVLGSGSSFPNTSHLFEITLRNDSPLPLIGNWNILVARLKPQESAVVHAASLPQIAAGAAWTSRMALDLSSFSADDIVDLAIFLCFNGLDNPARGTIHIEDTGHRSNSSIALLHVFRVDSLHSLQACSGMGGGSGGSSRNSIRSSYYSSNSQALGIKLGVPKQLFGLEPEPQIILDVLLKQGERSLDLPLTKQIANGKTSKTSAAVDNGVIVQRRQQKAVVQGKLPIAYSAASQSNNATAAGAMLSIQPAPFSLAAASSPHASLDLTCEAGNVVNCLKLHKAALRRVQLLQAAVQESGSVDSGGIQLAHGVVVPSACSFGATIDSNEIEEISGNLSRLKEAAAGLREAIIAAETTDWENEAVFADEDRKVTELLELVKNTRDQTNSLAITL